MSTTTTVSFVVRNLRPGLCRGAVRPHAQTGDAEIRGELQVGVAIAHHEAARLVERIGRHIVPHHADVRFATAAIFPLEVRTDEDSLELDALRREERHYEAMRGCEFLVGQTRSTQPVLIGDHDERKTGAFQFEQRRNDAGHQADFLQAIHLFVRRLFIQRTVAIQEKDPPARIAGGRARDGGRCTGVHSRSTAASSASFCARVPTEIRSDLGNAG
jgi:hypothetical protein